MINNIKNQLFNALKPMLKLTEMLRHTASDRFFDKYLKTKA